MAHLSERAQQAGHALLELGGAARPGDVGRATGFDHNRQSRALEDLERAGFITRTKARVELTPAGWDALVARPRPTTGELDEALALWPYRHRAFLELLLDATIARRHLTGHVQGHLGFMAIGARGTGKSSMFDVACHLLGLDPVDHTLFVPEQTEGSIGGRREQGPEGWRFAPAPAMALDLVLFDEFDKADDAVRRAVWPYFQGRLEVSREGQRFRYAPTPMLASNVPQGGDRYRHLRGEYWRRAVVLDTGDTRTAVPHLEEELTAFFADQRWRGLLRLDDLEPPAQELAEWRPFFKTIENVLTPEGAEVFCGTRSLELATLGRQARLGLDAAIEDVAISVTHDYLACAESVPGLAEPEWHLQLDALRQQLDGKVELAALEAALRRRRDQAADAARRVRAARRLEQAEDLALIGDRGRLVTALQTAHDELDGRRVPREHKSAAGGIRAQLKELRASAGKVTTRGRLDELQELARGPLAAANELRATIDADKAREAAERQRQREEARAARSRHPSSTQPSKAQRREWETGLETVRSSARQLEALYKRKTTKSGEHPLEVLRSLRLPGGHPVIEHVPAPPRGRRSMWEALANYQRPDFWRSTLDAHVTVEVSKLKEWGSGSRALLEPALAKLHGLEDHFAALLGRKPRRGRVVVQGGPSNVVPLRRANPYAALPGPRSPFGA